MKRDMDLIRQILLQVEARPTAQSIDLVEVPGHEQEEISYHVKLLADAGYLGSARPPHHGTGRLPIRPVGADEPRT